MTLSIIAISLGTGLSYVVVAAIYLTVCFIVIKCFKKSGIICAALLCILMVLQISHWYKLELQRQLVKAELVERTPEIYDMLSQKFKEFDKNKDGQIDSWELAHYKTTCSCNASTVAYLNSNLESIGDLRQVEGRKAVMFTINHDDLETLKQEALNAFQSEIAR